MKGGGGGEGDVVDPNCEQCLWQACGAVNLRFLIGIGITSSSSMYGLCGKRKDTVNSYHYSTTTVSNELTSTVGATPRTLAESQYTHWLCGVPRKCG